MSDFAPMLAGKATTDKLQYPLLLSPKLDGVRAVVRNGRVLSRNLLELPNPTVQALFGDPRFNGFDGELIVGDPTAQDAFRLTSSCVMSHSPLSKFYADQLRFHLFDDFSCASGFENRLAMLAKRVGKSAKIFQLVPHLRVINHHGVELYEEEYVSQGYEGVMLRDPLGRYKHGRSTTKEGLLLKLKRFEDAEAKVLGVKELQHNENDDRTGGLAKRRSSKQAGKVGGETLGALQVVGINGEYEGVKFDVGSGFKAAERQELWMEREQLVGKLVSYRYFPLGSKDKPRFPTFRGFRHRADL